MTRGRLTLSCAPTTSACADAGGHTEWADVSEAEETAGCELELSRPVAIHLDDLAAAVGTAQPVVGERAESCGGPA
jgi:hypothetical protein